MLRVAGVGVIDLSGVKHARPTQGHMIILIIRIFCVTYITFEVTHQIYLIFRKYFSQLLRPFIQLGWLYLWWPVGYNLKHNWLFVDLLDQWGPIACILTSNLPCKGWNLMWRTFKYRPPLRIQPMAICIIIPILTTDPCVHFVRWQALADSRPGYFKANNVSSTY